jgi:hypothetical protein
MWWLLIVLVVIVFYLLVPGIGFVVVRQNWRRFRRLLIDSTSYPYLDYSDLQKPMKNLDGPFRFLGKLQAFEESGNIWLSSEKLSVKVDLSQTRVYTLPTEDAMATDNPESLDATRISILPQQSQFFVFGELTEVEGNRMFQNTSERPLLVLLYDGESKTILSRAVSHARHRNEFWNQLTPFSVGIGFLFLLLMSYFFLSQEGQGFLAVFSMAMALWPLSFFLPPGVGLLYFFRRFWIESRALRTSKEIIDAAMHFFPDWKQAEDVDDVQDIQIATGARYGVRRLDPQVVQSQEKSVEHDFLSKDNLLYKVGILDPIGQQKDPVLSPYYFPFEPCQARARLKKKARIGEILALFFLVLGAVINGSLLLYILVQVMN